jgi:hypothetical protein
VPLGKSWYFLFSGWYILQGYEDLSAQDDSEGEVIFGGKSDQYQKTYETVMPEDDAWWFRQERECVPNHLEVAERAAL